jgi:two-component system sensor histidine kinase ChiS
LEGLTKFYDASVIISSATHQGLLDPSNYKIRYLDRVCVKGKEEVIRLFEVFDGDPPELQVLKVETQENLARAQELYYDKRFVDAQVELFKVLARNPTDKVAWHFLVQAAQCLKEGVPETWDRRHCNDNKMTEDFDGLRRMVSACSEWSITP